ncbi:MAG: hypothetical protein HY664_02605 [Chloroflexi bacterium]|nr:hypothetical protein [Chloroflexota bacterium]
MSEPKRTPARPYRFPQRWPMPTPTGAWPPTRGATIADLTTAINLDPGLAAEYGDKLAQDHESLSTKHRLKGDNESVVQHLEEAMRWARYPALIRAIVQLI